MKKYWRILFSLLLITVLLTITGCSLLGQKKKTFPHTFRQDRQNVAKIEICTYEHEYGGGKREPLVELSESEMDEIWSDISSLECHKFVLLDPILSYGDTIIAITYLDGEVEMLGIHNIGRISADGDFHTTGYRFEMDDICGVITKYVDSNILEENSEFFKQRNQRGQFG